MDTDMTKPWWQSLGVWGAATAMVASAASFLGYTITPDDQVAMLSTAERGVHLAMEVAAFIGGVASLWGRIRATKLIG